MIVARYALAAVGAIVLAAGIGLVALLVVEILLSIVG